MLFGQPLFWFCTGESYEEEQPDAYLELSDDSTAYGQLPEDVRDFLNKCMMTNDLQRPRLAKLLQDPVAKAHLGWPDEWGVG